MRFHPAPTISEHKLTSSGDHRRRKLMALGRIHKMMTPGKRPSKVEKTANVELLKAAFNIQGTLEQGATATNAGIQKLLQWLATLPGKAVGRVVTNLVKPEGYDDKLSDITDSLKEEPKAVLSSIWKDTPLPFISQRGTEWGRQSKKETWIDRDEPYRAMFGLQPRAWANRYPTNTNGTFRLDPDNTEQLREDLTREAIINGPRDSYAAQNPRVLGNVTLTRNPNNSYHYRDPWDFDLHPGEKVNTKVNALRYLFSKITKPVVFEGDITKSGTLYDFDGTLAPEIKGDAKTYRAALAKLGPEDLSGIGKGIGNSVDIATSRPECFHADIRSALERMGVHVGDIHAAGFDKTETIRKLNRPLVDNNPEVVDKIRAALGDSMATLVPTHKRATWGERYLSMFAARDAAHQADPQQDALGTKLLGGPLSLGLSEAYNNRAIMGTSAGEREQAMRSAVKDVKAESYYDAVLRGLRAAPAYAVAGGAAGAILPAAGALWRNETPSGLRSLQGGALGATGGVLTSVLRPVLQKVILNSTSSRSQRAAIATKARHPILTALPFGDAVGAMRS